MEWQTPQFLYLILPLCLSWLALALYSEKRRQRARETFIATAMQGRILPATSRFRFWCKLLLFELALAAGLIALAGPRFGTQVEQVIPRGSDLYVLIDVSRSMLADDVVPSRLERAKADVSSLVNRLNGERIGLIAFAGKAVVKCPLTIDYDSFRRALMELDPSSAPRGGTAIGDAIRKAVEVFHAGTQRDQAVLLITDGDDQESFPLEAATVAAERKVTVFTVGLGDSSSGARIPGARTPEQSGVSSFMEHEGQQVWSKLNGSLLSDIALKTNGVYIPAGTRSYDLGELYAQHLQGRTGDQSETQQRIRKSERFQIFLSLSLLALLVDLCISRYSNIPVRHSTAAPTASASSATRSSRSDRERTSSRTPSLPEATHRSSKTLPLLAGIGITLMSDQINADESHEQVRAGLKHYQAAEYDSAEKLFAAAAEELDKSRSSQAAVAAFDEACALHRKGDKEKARERYLKAGLSPDTTIATVAHFNLGTLSAENARSIAGVNPENVASEDRQKILDELKLAVSSYRHALELNPEHRQSRRNLELVRTWIKYYSDRWNEIDRQKRRDESNLIQFLEFLMTTQTAMQGSIQTLPENVPPDVYAQFKKDQDELAAELPFLREKIAAELVPQRSSPGANPLPQSTQSQSTLPQSIPPEVKAGIELLQSWSDKAADSMRSASHALLKTKTADAVTHQQEAVTQLDQIWDAVIPFHPLLARELRDQTVIAEQLAPLAPTPASTSETSSTVSSVLPEGSLPISSTDEAEQKTEEEKKLDDNAGTNSLPTRSAPLSSHVEFEESDLQSLLKQQSKTLRKARLLAPKAQAELERLETNLPEAANATQVPDDSADIKPADPANPMPAPQVNPEQIKQGLQKAVELSPKAVEAMQLAVDHLQRKDPKSAAAPAEEARRILEEIQNHQPKDPQQDQKDEDQDKQKQDDQSQKNDEQQKENKQNDDNKKSQEQDQKKKQDSKQTQNEKNPGEDKQEKKKEDQKKPSDQKKDDKQKQDEEKSGNKSGDSRNKSQASDANSEQPQVSRDRIEDALRKVRERQQEKRERDREMRARIIGRTPVEKDW